MTMKNILVSLFVLVMVLGLGFFYITVLAPDMRTSQANSERCISKGGIWIQKYRECSGVGGEICEAIGGTYNGCASACRHDPPGRACIMMCVEVCKL